MPVTTAASKKTRERIDARVAANAAAAYFKNLYSTVTAFSLEEVELSENGKYWLITLSFEIPAHLGSGFPLPFQPPKTKYKIFKVDAQTGSVVAMKIRKLE